MIKEQNQVKEFMVKAEQLTPDKPTMPDADVRRLRVKLIAEELLELSSAYGLRLTINDEGEIGISKLLYTPNMAEAYDAVLDLLVVTIGAGVAMGVDLQPGWEEVHRSNMSKFIDGHRREDGKWVRGPSYSPARLVPIIEGMKCQQSTT